MHARAIFCLIDRHPAMADQEIDMVPGSFGGQGPTDSMRTPSQRKLSPPPGDCRISEVSRTAVGGRQREANMTDQKEVERDCPECDSTGQDRNMRPVRLGEKNDFQPCTKCGGSGKIREAAD